MDEKMIQSFLRIAEKMIEAGAEVYRVEECLNYMCTAYGAVRTDAFVTTSNMTLNVEKPDGSIICASRRASLSGYDMECVDRFNSLVRYITKERPSLQVINQRIEEALVYKKYKVWQVVLCSLIIAGSFSMFFGSRDIVEIALSSAIGAVMEILNQLAKKAHMNGMMIRFCNSAIFSALAFAATKMGLVPSPDYIIMGNIMSLIPGCGITSAVRDLFTGDTFTGIIRTIECMLNAASMALGYIVVAYLFGGAI